MPENIHIINLAFTCLLGLVGFFGGMFIKDLAKQIEKLQAEDKELREKLEQYAKVASVDEWRREQKEIYSRIFIKLDDIKDALHGKVDRDECRNCGQ